MSREIDFPFPTEALGVTGFLVAATAVSVLIERSAWFVFTPQPNDRYELVFKRGEGIADAIAHRIVEQNKKQARLGHLNAKAQP